MTTEPKPVLTVPLARMLLELSMDDESDYMTRIVLRSAANVIETLVVERKERDAANRLAVDVDTTRSISDREVSAFFGEVESIVTAHDNAPVHVPAPEPRATPEFRIVASALAHAIDRSTAEIKALDRAINNMQVLLKALVNQGEKR